MFDHSPIPIFLGKKVATAAQEHILASAFKKHDAFKNSEQKQISSQCAFTYERYSVPMTALKQQLESVIIPQDKHRSLTFFLNGLDLQFR